MLVLARPPPSPCLICLCWEWLWSSLLATSELVTLPLCIMTVLRVSSSGPTYQLAASMSPYTPSPQVLLQACPLTHHLPRCPKPSASGNCHPVLRSYKFASSRFHLCDVRQCLFSPCGITEHRGPRSVLAEGGRTPLSPGWLHSTVCVCLLGLFICWQTRRLCSYLGGCEWHCGKHGIAGIFLISCFPFLWIDTLEWNQWIRK